ncbi:hypothetical protein CKO42_05740 [Lamprobacter modestohalophilus]|uniref:DUF29 domain-containing protein n=1 Tax=Lamprobacter modestohalophilus TaxID=1064514 RepID=A0A9X0W6P5_9GAMM|nr:DUF29 domain-containing protein [Lamprobacter modestohalophilus]MBK1617963.1 hypothetical protein [Lamprobacter modestohalophilus]MCF8015349.1 DUF29 domain-containing protein [Chromatiaceae bacterium]
MSTYDTDFHQWIEEQSALLRAGSLAQLDVTHLIEELEGMSARERRELINRLAVLLAHLLKWEYQPERRSISWRLTINEQRRQLALLLEDSPSLRQRLPELLVRSYRHATRAAMEETGFLTSPFPEHCAYSISEILNEDYWPAGH